MRRWYRFIQDLVYGLGWLAWGMRVEGLENVPPAGPLLVTSNHVSNLDPALVGCTLPREAGFVAKKELFAVPGLGALIRSLNAMPLDRSRLSMEAMGRFGAFLESGKALVYFPEGTRSRDGRLRKAKIGVGILLSRHPVTVIPVRVQGTDSLFRNLFRRGRIRVVYGRPYALPREERNPPTGREEYRRIADAVMDRIRRLARDADSREAGLSAEETPWCPEGRGAVPAGIARIM